MSESASKVVMFNPQASQKLPYDGPPLSILMAVSMLDLSVYDVKIIDWHSKDYRARIAGECQDAMIFGVTCMTGFQIGKMLESLQLAKRANPVIKTVVGGWHPTLLPEQTLCHPLVDYIVQGQGPRTFQRLADALREGGDVLTIEGVGGKRDGQTVINPRPPLEPIDHFPFPPLHLLDNIEHYLVETSYAKRVLYLLSSQGCPANCYFCSEAAFHNRRWSARSVDAIIDYIKPIQEQYGIDGVAVSDSNFFVDERRVAEFCRCFKELGLKWGSTSSRSDQLARYKDETWRLMAESGLHDIFLGVESASNDTLRIMNKGNRIEDTLAVLPKAAKYGIKVQCAFVIGVPGSDIKADFKADMEFINRVRKSGQCTQFHMFTFAPFPGIPFIEESRQLGYRQPESLEEWGNYNLHMDVCPWIPSKYPDITDQLSVYFMFLTGNARTVIASVAPRGTRWLALIAESLFRNLAEIRVQHLFFRVPIEHRLVKFVIRHRERFFGDAKLVF